MIASAPKMLSISCVTPYINGKAVEILCSKCKVNNRFNFRHKMIVTKTKIPDVLLIEPKRFGDDRGFFSEVFKEKILLEHIGPLHFVQDNHSVSQKKIRYAAYTFSCHHMLKTN